MFGTFLEHWNDLHVNRRELVLRQSSWFPYPEFLKLIDLQADHFFEKLEFILKVLQENGLVTVNLDRPLSNNEFLAFGKELGNPMLETTLGTEKYIENNMILNLIQEQTETSNIVLQPFAENYLTFHTETSGRKLTDQTRYIVLMCLEAPLVNSGGQTILIPMTSVHQKLNTDQIEILSHTRYSQDIGSPPFYSWREERPIFSFRDFGNQPIHWIYEGPDPSITEVMVNNALRALLVALYDPTFTFGIPWSRNALAVIDNTFYFHAKTLGRIEDHKHLRHLKRLRIRN